MTTVREERITDMQTLKIQVKYLYFSIIFFNNKLRFLGIGRNKATGKTGALSLP